MYPTVKAKTVIQEIEEEKRKEIALGKRKQIEDDNVRHLLATTVYIHQTSDHHPSRGNFLDKTNFLRFFSNIN